jgi:DNA-directed RNA polymerase specialized sigma24 family protein
VLHDLDGFDVSEIADIVGANPLTVRSRLRNGRRKLRHLLKLERGLVWEEA